MDSVTAASNARRPWTAPAIVDLPPLRELTLQTGTGIPGGDTNGGAGTFSY